MYRFTFTVSNKKIEVIAASIMEAFDNVRSKNQECINQIFVKKQTKI